MDLKDLINIRDFFLFQPEGKRSGGESSNPEVRRIAQTAKGLKATLSASHAGIINGNNYFYLPKGMQNSLHTWTVPQPKPVQIQHDDFDDPIGRVFSSAYVPLVDPNNKDRFSDHVVRATQVLQDSKTKREVFDAIRLLDSTGVLDDPNWKGVGELQLSALITDQLAIQKILDGRYLGISVGQKVNELYCSVCEKNLVKEGEPCEHIGNLGGTDKETGKKVFLIIGDTSYQEVSYVNRPADSFAATIKTELADNLQLSSEVFDTIDKTDTREVTYELIDSLVVEETMDVLETAETQPETETSVIEDAVIEPEAGEVVVATEVVTEEVITDAEVEPAAEPVEVEDLSEEKLLEEALRVLFEDNESLTEEMVERINAALEVEVETEDAKLSTEKRKSLPSSSFCGPGRSFPVPDKAHCTAARRLLGTYKGPGDKTKISACIERKCKALGMEKKDLEESQVLEEDKLLCLDCLEDEKLQKLFLDCETLLVAKGLKVVRECTDCKDKEENISSLMLEVTDLKDTVKILREEYRLVLSEYSALEQEHDLQLQKTFDTVKSFYGKVLPLTKDEEKHDPTISELTDYLNSVDLSDVINIVTTGVVKEPEADAHVTIQDAAVVEEVIVEENHIDKELFQKLLDWKSQYGERSATNYLESLKNKGRVDKDLNLAKIEEFMAE